MRHKIILILIFVLMSSLALAENEKPVIYFFFGQGCPHCGHMELFLDNMKEKYPIEVKKFEVYFNQSNRELFEKLSKAYGTEIKGVPTVFIDKKVIVGYSKFIEKEIKSKINECIKNGCISPEEMLNGDENEITEKLTWATLIGAAAVDSINPCTLAVLLILLTTLIATGKKKKALGAGIGFTLAIYISYFLMGLGIYSAVKLAGHLHTFYYFVIGVAILVGLLSIRDYFTYKPGVLAIEIPMKWRPKLKKVLRSVTSVPGAALIGFLCSLLLLPCSSGPYLVILGLLAKTATRMAAIPLLMVYNAIFVLPMLFITFLVYFGIARTEEVHSWREKHIKLIHLISGIIMIALALLLAYAMYIRWV